MKLDIFCEYCKKTHTINKRSYTENFERNKRYICIHEGGHIGGSSPKPGLHYYNPLKEQGLKKCSQCKLPKSVLLFSHRKASRDGLSAACKECLAQKDRKIYLDKLSRQSKPDTEDNSY